MAESTCDPEEAAMLQQLFEALDRDGDGTIVRPLAATRFRTAQAKVAKPRVARASLLVARKVVARPDVS